MTIKEHAAELVKLSVTELIELVAVLKDEYGLTMNTAVAVEKVEETEVVEEKTTFDVNLKSDRLNETVVKMAVIRIVKAVAGNTLQEAKAMVESAPVKIKENVSKAEADNIVEQLTTAGATVEIL